MNGWSGKDVTKATGETISGIVTNRPITVEGFPITAGGATKGLIIKVKTSAATVVGTVTVKLQTALGPDYRDEKTAVISAAGIVYIKFLDTVAGDQAFLPLLNKGQVVLTTTNAGDSVTIQSVEILQAL